MPTSGTAVPKCMYSACLCGVQSDLRTTRVAVVHNLPAPYRLQLFDKMLNDNDLDVRIFFTGRLRGNRPSWSKDFRPGDSRIAYLPEVSLPLRGKSADRIDLNFSLGRVFSWKPDVVLLYGYQEPTNALIAVACRLKKIPYVLSAEISFVWDSTFTGKVFNRLIGPIIRNASYLVPSSRSCSMFFAHLGGDGNRMRIIPPLPDTRQRASACAEKRKHEGSIRSRFDLTGRFVVLYIGRFEDYKGIHELLAAMENVAARLPRVCFAFVGQGSLQPEVEEGCRKIGGSGRFLGPVDDDTLIELLSIADVHVMPSWHEAYGIVTAEALACGVPSIVTRSSGNRDLVTDGVNGFVIEPKSAKAISDSIVSLTQDPVRLDSMKKSAAASMADFSLDGIYKSLKEVIVQTASESKRRVQ